MLYAELRAIAGSHLHRERPGHTLQATALVHEAFLKLSSSPQFVCESRKHFLSIASRAMRCILVDHARARSRQKRDGGERITLEDFSAVAPSDVGVLELEFALNKLESVDPRKVRALELVSFGGASYTEAAEVLEISEATLHRDLKMARAWVRRELAKAG
jgi:RNA polymerase sigma factor (TIGR02999 family)